MPYIALIDEESGGFIGTRSTDLVPRIGDCVHRNGKYFRVKDVIWFPDQTKYSDILAVVVVNEEAKI